jgi:hypothetical protein
MSKLPAKLRNRLKKEAFAWEASLSEERPEKVERTSRGTLLTNITKRFAASSNRDIIVLCHDKRDWMLLGRFIM